MKKLSSKVLEAASLLHRKRIGLDSNGDQPGPVQIGEIMPDHPRIRAAVNSIEKRKFRDSK